MKQITRLTKEQEESLSGFAQERIAIQLNTISTPGTELEAWENIKRAYVVAGIEEPTQIVFYDSVQDFAKKVSTVGDTVRATVWDVGATVGATVRATVWATVRDTVWATVRDTVWDTVRDTVWDTVEDTVRATVWATVGATVRATVGATVRDTVWTTVGATVWDVGAAVRGYDDAGWHGFYGFFNKLEQNDLRFLDRFNQLVQGYCLTADTVYVMRKPAKLNRDDNGRLHSTTEHCWEDRSGFGFYALFGVVFDENLWQKVTGKDTTFKDIVSIKNTEQRMAALKLYGTEAMLLQSGAKLLEKSKNGNELYEVVDVFPETEYALKFACPSTGRVYVEFVDPEIGKRGDADLAQASMWKITKDEYLSCEEQT